MRNELNNNEKYYYFDESLPDHHSDVKRIENGDIMLYGDNCPVIFYESFNISCIYTKIGRIDNSKSLADSVDDDNVEISFSK